MRVSDRIVYTTAAQRVNRTMSELDRHVANLSDGRDVRQPSDDPLRFERGRSAEAQLDKLEAYTKSINRIFEENGIADSALSSLQEIFARGFELAVWGASEEWSPALRQQVANEAVELFESAVALVNTKVGSNYLFSGSRENTQPFLADGTYVGGNVEPQVEVAPGVNVKSRYDGSTLFASAGGTVLTALENLRNGLQTGVGLQNVVSELDTAIADLGRAQTTIGTSGYSMIQARNVVDLMSMETEQVMTSARASDFIKESSALALTKRSLEGLQQLVPASLSMGMLKLF